jgi:C-terminal processing protease CtpA/Prc
MHSSYRNLTYESSSGDDCFQEEENDRECGIGLTLKQSKGKFIVASIEEDGGGERSGAIHVNDIILQIEGVFFKLLVEKSCVFRTASCRRNICADTSNTASRNIVSVYFFQL